MYYTREKLDRPTYFSCFSACYVSRRFHSLLFKHHNTICSRVQIMELLTGSCASFFHSSFYFQDCSAIIAMDYGLRRRGSIPGKGKRFLSKPQRSDRLCGPPSVLYNWYRGYSRGVNMTTHLHRVPRLRMVALCLHSPYILKG